MDALVVTSTVGEDGVLKLDLPLGMPEAGREVRVTVEALPIREQNQAEYVAWLGSIAGQWQGDFERMPQGEFEQREPSPHFLEIRD